MNAFRSLTSLDQEPSTSGSQMANGHVFRSPAVSAHGQVKRKRAVVLASVSFGRIGIAGEPAAGGNPVRASQSTAFTKRLPGGRAEPAMRTRPQRVRPHGLARCGLTCSQDEGSRLAHDSAPTPASHGLCNAACIPRGSSERASGLRDACCLTHTNPKNGRSDTVTRLPMVHAARKRRRSVLRQGVVVPQPPGAGGGQRIRCWLSNAQEHPSCCLPREKPGQNRPGRVPIRRASPDTRPRGRSETGPGQAPAARTILRRRTPPGVVPQQSAFVPRQHCRDPAEICRVRFRDPER